MPYVHVGRTRKQAAVGGVISDAQRRVLDGGVVFISSPAASCYRAAIRISKYHPQPLLPPASESQPPMGSTGGGQERLTSHRAQVSATGIPIIPAPPSVSSGGWKRVLSKRDTGLAIP
ncbi:hypothetical protein KM043_009195 [Ampulex compressa]|nr:hypothetical protein KM043_009195 [Ampulex compressa]